MIRDARYMESSVPGGRAKMAQSKLAQSTGRKQWSTESMLAAVEKVGDGMGLREAARLFNVPVETLRRRVNGTVSVDCRPGPHTVLTSEEESKLVQYVVNMSDMGFGLTKEDVMRTAFAIVAQSGRPHPFQNGAAGHSWFDLNIPTSPYVQPSLCLLLGLLLQTKKQ